MPGKREDYSTWDEYFMGIAFLSATRSKDPSTQVGACIVKNNVVLSVGYNGLTLGMDDDTFYWNSEGEITGDKTRIKDPFVVHAERNAIYNYKGPLSDLKGSTLYVTFFPCHECIKSIIQVGIKRIVYRMMYTHLDSLSATGIMIKAAGIEVVPFAIDADEVSKDQYRSELKDIQKIIKRYTKK